MGYKLSSVTRDGLCNKQKRYLSREEPVNSVKAADETSCLVSHCLAAVAVATFAACAVLVAVGDYTIVAAAV